MASPKQILKIFLFFLVVWLCCGATAIAAEDPASHVFDVPVNTADLLLTSALETLYTDMDCSHLVHRLYETSGLGYVYADSTHLYKGVKAFRRVSHPQAGDLIVWQGHVGIVVDPEEHTFVSALRTGVKVASYVSRYWKGRGIPRFFHYVGQRMPIESAAID
jgi:hypothetical protein